MHTYTQYDSLQLHLSFIGSSRLAPQQGSCRVCLGLAEMARTVRLSASGRHIQTRDAGWFSLTSGRQSDIAKLEAIAVRNAFELFETRVKGMSTHIHLVGWCGQIIPSQNILTIGQDC
jgi:hypothetical protein